MTPMIDPTLHAQLIHAVKLMLECVIAAGALTFLWIVAPALRGGPRR